jgi:hypothetical protein
MRTKLLRRIAPVLGVLVISLSTMPQTAGAAQRGTFDRVVVPSSQFRTIQEGIDAVVDGGSVIIRPGIYSETLTISKRVVLLGNGATGDDRTELMGADPDRGTVNFANGGGGVIASMLIRGGAYGIAAPAEEGSASSLALRDLMIAETGRGIFGRFSDLRVSDVEIRGTSWNAVSLLAALGGLTFVDDVFADSGHVGMYIINNVGEIAPILISNVQLFDNPGGGIVVYGDGRDVYIQESDLIGNNYAGIRLMNVGLAVITDTLMAFTDPRSDGGFGDGLIAFCSGRVAVVGSQAPTFTENLESDRIIFNGRAGISAFGSDVTIKNTLMYGNPIDMDSESYPCGPGPDPIESTWSNEGGNLCFDQQGSQIYCQLKSSDLAPPSALVEPP